MLSSTFPRQPSPAVILQRLWLGLVLVTYHLTSSEACSSGSRMEDGSCAFAAVCPTSLLNGSIFINNLHKGNWSRANTTRLPARNFDIPTCDTKPVVVSNSSLNTSAVCPWTVVTDTNPLRIPRDIQYANCSCQVNVPPLYYPCGVPPIFPGEKTVECQQNYVTLPSVLCDRDPLRSQPLTCNLTLIKVAVSCQAVYPNCR